RRPFERERGIAAYPGCSTHFALADAFLTVCRLHCKQLLPVRLRSWGGRLTWRWSEGRRARQGRAPISPGCLHDAFAGAIQLRCELPFSNRKLLEMSGPFCASPPAWESLWILSSPWGSSGMIGECVGSP